MTKTFLDSGVYIEAWLAVDSQTNRVIELLDDEARSFFTAQSVRNEVFPKAVHFKNQAETRFYTKLFALSEKEEPLSETLGQEAYRLSCRYGISAADALNLAAAIRLDCHEFVSTEKPGKPIYRCQEINVIHFPQA